MHLVTDPQRILAILRMAKNMTDHGERVFFSLPSHGNAQPSRMENQATIIRSYKAT
jgi:hypothetical protein